MERGAVEENVARQGRGAIKKECIDTQPEIGAAAEPPYHIETEAFLSLDAKVVAQVEVGTLNLVLSNLHVSVRDADPSFEVSFRALQSHLSSPRAPRA